MVEEYGGGEGRVDCFSMITTKTFGQPKSLCLNSFSKEIGLIYVYGFFRS